MQPRVLIALLIVLGLPGLSSCTTLPAAASAHAPLAVARDDLQAFALAGRFSVRQEGKNYPGRLHWRHDGDRDELLLSSPFGQGLAEIVSDAGGARLATSDGSSYTAATADELLQSCLLYTSSEIAASDHKEVIDRFGKRSGKGSLHHRLPRRRAQQAQRIESEMGKKSVGQL